MSHRNARLPPVALAGFLSVFFGFPFFAKAEFPTQESPVATTTPQTVEAAKNDATKPGKHVTAPKLIHSVEPEIPQIVRKTNQGGIVLVSCYVETDGIPSDVHVVRTTVDQGKKTNEALIAQALAENAVDAVSRYRFKPAKEDGKPVRVQLNVTVSFRP
jgi:TonB family protein